MSEVTIEQLEDQRKNEQAVVDRRDAALRLANNRDFKKLILDGFCGTEAARYVQESGDPMLTREQREDALNMAQASGHLKRFLSYTVLFGNTAARTIKELEEALDEARGEGAE